MTRASERAKYRVLSADSDDALFLILLKDQVVPDSDLIKARECEYTLVKHDAFLKQKESLYKPFIGLK